MSFPRSPFCVILCTVAICRIALAQQDTTPVNADAILRDLDQIEQQQKQAVQSARITAISQIKAAASNGAAATNLYERAIEDTQFDGTRNKGGSFADWKASKAEILRTKEVQAALLMHLKYLVLSLERKASDKPELFAPVALDYAVELAALDPLFFKQQEFIKEQKDKRPEDVAVQNEAAKMKDELLNKSLAESLFVKWLRLGSWLPAGDNWELTPGNIPGILEKDVRPFLRKAKNPQVVETWEFEMKVLADRITFGRLEHQAAEFNTVTRPRLQFSRANDMVEIGQKNRAASEIYSMVKTYPQHPDFTKWVQRLRELLKSAEPAPATAPAATPESPKPAA
ncbi:MAG: hypothetical protein ACOYMS_03680 [Terrimicrobiaceae bacterium]